MQFVFDSVIIAGSIGLVYLWGQFGTEELTVPLLGLLVFLYIVSNVSRKVLQKSPRTLPHESFHAAILVITSLLLISSTGNLTSPFFFLLYFLPFAVSFLLSPPSALTFAAVCSLFFFHSLLLSDYLRGIMQIGSVIALSPIAYWVGMEYRHHMAVLSQNLEVASKVTKDIGTIITDKEKKLTHKESKALTDILGEVEKLKKET